MTKYYSSASELDRRDRQHLDLAADEARLKEVREWRGRLARAHRGGYHLVDAYVGTVLLNVAFLLRKLDEGKRE